MEIQSHENPRPDAMKTGRKPRLRRVYVLPNLISAINLFLGVWALMHIYEGNLEKACWMIFLAGLLDGLDGAVARLTRTQSEFGLQLDSLADIVSLGIAPAMAAFALMSRIPAVNHQLTVGVCALYAICCALRLARYNVQAQGEERRSFVGLPTPAGAAGVIFVLLVIQEYQLHLAATSHTLSLLGIQAVIDSSLVAAFLPLILIGLSLLMVSEVPYPHMFRLRRRMSFDSLVSLILIGVLILALKSDMRVLLLFLMGYAYIAYGMARYIYRFISTHRPSKPSMAEPSEH